MSHVVTVFERASFAWVRAGAGKATAIAARGDRALRGPAPSSTKAVARLARPARRSGLGPSGRAGKMGGRRVLDVSGYTDEERGQPSTLRYVYPARPSS